VGLDVGVFDFLEGESELVSGFNVEYGGGAFALIFLGEYLLILFIAFFFRSLFFMCRSGFRAGFCYFYLFLRRVFPRFRYDFLIYFL